MLSGGDGGFTGRPILAHSRAASADCRGKRRNAPRRSRAIRNLANPLQRTQPPSNKMMIGYCDTTAPREPARWLSEA